ncbi:MAG: NAD-dependent epimerase/dehydratase family protein [Chloroflexi bacterium]|nr:MAG: NAD-dependent epimerase/dehydratase family protein [Chloroflexota bacterium]
MILVTGATGHIGNVLVRELVKRGEKVRALALPGDNLSPLAGLDVEFVTGDVLDIESLRAACRGAQDVFHLAAIITIMPGKTSKCAGSTLMERATCSRPRMRPGCGALSTPAPSTRSSACLMAWSLTRTRPSTRKTPTGRTTAPKRRPVSWPAGRKRWVGHRYRLPDWRDWAVRPPDFINDPVHFELLTRRGADFHRRFGLRFGGCARCGGRAAGRARKRPQGRNLHPFRRAPAFHHYAQVDSLPHRAAD